MAKQDHELIEAREQLADAQAQIDSLQSAAADAEARAETAGDDLASVRAELVEARAQAESSQAELASAQAELIQARSAQAELVEAVRDTALKYRDARLAAAPHVPPDLVPGETVAQIDQQLEAAQKVVSTVREQVQQESQSSRVPAGAPPRRAPDLSALSPAEKIKLGLQERERR